MSSTEPAPIPRIGTPAFYRDPYPTYRALLDSGARSASAGAIPARCFSSISTYVGLEFGIDLAFPARPPKQVE